VGGCIHKTLRRLFISFSGLYRSSLAKSDVVIGLATFDPFLLSLSSNGTGVTSWQLLPGAARGHVAVPHHPYSSGLVEL